MDLSVSAREPYSEVVSTFFACLSEPSVYRERHEEVNDEPVDLRSVPAPRIPAQNLNIADLFLALVDEINNRLNYFHVPQPVECIYNPTIYARHTFERYVRRYCNTTKQIMFFGMNPGPWGMSQTGVPFGEVKAVRDWLGISGPIGEPPRVLPARPVLGFNCTRSEISGKRFWGLCRELCGAPDNFFASSFVYNYLPQQWMKANGCNVTPSDFKVSQMQPLYDICDPIFIRVVELYQVQIIVAVGKFCEIRATKALKRHLPHRNIRIVYLPHPSPRTVNNVNWGEKALEHLRTHNLLQYYTAGNQFDNALDLTTT